MGLKAFLLAALLPLCAWAEGELKLISVRGEGEIKAAPDIVKLSLTIWAKDKDAKKAQERNAKDYERITKVLKEKFKIGARDIQTLNINLSPEYDYSSGKQIYRGYAANHRLLVIIRELKNVGEVLDSAPTDARDKEAGASIDHVEFATEKRKQYENEALALAVANAKERAQAIAKAAGQSLGGLVRIADAQSNFSAEPFIQHDSVMAVASLKAARTEVSPGEITITSSVQAQYSF